MSKKVISLILALTIVVSVAAVALLTTTATPAQYDTIINFGGKQYGADEGDEITVSYNAKYTDPLVNFQGSLYFDDSVLVPMTEAYFDDYYEDLVPLISQKRSYGTMMYTSIPSADPDPAQALFVWTTANGVPFNDGGSIVLCKFTAAKGTTDLSSYVVEMSALPEGQPLVNIIKDNQITVQGLTFTIEISGVTVIVTEATTEATTEPTPEPTTEETTEQPTTEPTEEPTTEPTTQETTEQPTTEPTEEPTTEPTTQETTEQPTTEPTEEPTTEPTTQETTSQPTTEPTEEPTTEPTTQETTEQPTTEATTAQPTTEPTTVAPTTAEPTTAPTTSEPTTAPATEEKGTIKVLFKPLDKWSGDFAVVVETKDGKKTIVGMQSAGKDTDGEDIFSAEIPKNAENIVFVSSEGDISERVPSEYIRDLAGFMPYEERADGTWELKLFDYVEPETTPGSASDNQNKNNDGTNVKTGSSSTAFAVLMLLVLAFGVIVFVRRKSYLTK